ncbi:DUF4406 domain-containing protein [uncultured Rikenella sp.]|uniref:DUF4406 domain-containing protein n=1 Tax=uncultured Rikenella sp. TaxID=368003 RepID=UPI002617F2D7|nr:DUF4406 domain-containing protein [uncultured Rikenella sp.]
MKVYISGPITGLPRKETERAFGAAEAEILARGHEPVNPLRNGLPKSATWHEHMRADLRQLLDCDAIYMIGEWWYSSGARLEWQLARDVGIIEYKQQ